MLSVLNDSNAAGGCPPEPVVVDIKADVRLHGLLHNEQIAHMQHEIHALRTRVAQLETLVNEVYHAPGMPGFERARADFSGEAETS